MIPIRDTIPHQRTPYVVYGLIAANALVFLYQMGMSPEQLHHFFQYYGVLPARYNRPEIWDRLGVAMQLAPFASSMFLHGGVLHILGNMWMLWIFGDNVEDWFGHVGFLIFYLFCGVASALLHLMFNWGSTLPTVGASGAIAGVMGAYFLLYPRARVVTLLPIFFFFTFIELPAVVFLGFWFAMQLLSGAAALGKAGAGGIAWWAHIGGFAAGALVVFLLGGAKPRRPTKSRPTLKPMWEKVDDYW